MLLLRSSVAAAFVLLCASILVHLSYPLLWNDETETAMYAQRILEFGYPRIHDDKNVVYELTAPLEVGTKEPYDAYIGSTWGQYYFAVPGVAAAGLVDDLYTKTLLVRLPFALAALAGLALLGALGALPFRATPSRASAVAIGFFLLCCLSVTLQLHAREARYYPVVLLLVAASAFLQTLRLGTGRLSGAGGVLLLAALLSLLFQFFPIAYYATSLGLGLDLVLRFLRDPAPAGERLARFAGRASPLLLSLVTVIPGWIFWETADVGRALYALPEAIGVKASPLRDVLDLLVRRGLLLPALFAFAVRKGLFLWTGSTAPSEAFERASEISRLCWLIVLAHVALIAQLPFTFDRYLVVAPPLLCLVTVLEITLAFELASRLGSRAGAARRLTVLGAIVMASLTADTLLGDLRGRLQELSTPYKGPLDYILPAIRAAFPETQELTIATNYESTAYMFYLGSRTLVGFADLDANRDLDVQPDIIVTRPWVENWDVLERLYASGDYSVATLPVSRDQPYNNIAQLTNVYGRMVPHRFVTPRPAAEIDRQQLFIRRHPARGLPELTPPEAAHGPPQSAH